MALTEEIELRYQDSKSDKVYNVQLEYTSAGYNVAFQYGRRNSALQNGRKNNSPLVYASAKKMYDEVVAEKLAKGYQIVKQVRSASSAQLPAKTQAPAAKQPSGINCQLLNPIEEEEVIKFLRDPMYIMQEKMDGRRTMIRIKSIPSKGPGARTIEGINRLGQVIAISTEIEQAVYKTGLSNVILDGELIGDKYYIFDLIGDDHKDLPYIGRWSLLAALIKPNNNLKLVRSAQSSSDKSEMFSELEENKAEGVVFKDINAPYSPGRPNSGGPQLKYKFYSTATLEVIGINTKRSIRLGAMGTHGLVDVGNCTIPPNKEIPSVGDKVEVRYLYMVGSLYQPVYLHVREDKLEADKIDTIKTKKEEDEN